MIGVRLNQAGYGPHETKTALALAQESLAGQPFRVVSDKGDTVLEGHVGTDRGSYGEFPHLYEMDFSGLSQKGKYRLVLGQTESPDFRIDEHPGDRLIPPTLEFFKVQRCGTNHASLHGACHLKDRARGGWHDAGDYLKFMVTAGVSELLMLTAYQRHPEAFQGAEAEAPVLQEARVGLDWMLRMWDAKHQVLYYQVGDATDHDKWRMPEADDAAGPPRKAWACEPGKGANVAGKAVASLALAASLWNDSTRRYYDPRVAGKYLHAARQIYAWGKKHPGPQSTTPDDYYHATGWKDDMALAAAELYRATGRSAYLDEAEQYAAEAGGATFDVDHVHALAHYEIARLDPGWKPRAAASMDADLQPLQEHARTDPFQSALPQYTWGSVEFLTGTALEALWYEDLTGDAKYHEMAQQQRDYVLGRNPWGVSMVTGAGADWPHHTHHQVADLTHTDIPGIWDQGPCNAADWKAQDITLASSDRYAPYQTDTALFHDDVNDFVTNEPTINTNALGLALASWFARQ